MPFLGLGTGLGSTMIVGDIVENWPAWPKRKRLRARQFSLSSEMVQAQLCVAFKSARDGRSVGAGTAEANLEGAIRKIRARP